jgi:hypothetical protein
VDQVLQIHPKLLHLGVKLPDGILQVGLLEVRLEAGIGGDACRVWGGWGRRGGWERGVKVKLTGSS